MTFVWSTTSESTSTVSLILSLLPSPYHYLTYSLSIIVSLILPSSLNLFLLRFCHVVTVFLFLFFKHFFFLFHCFFLSVHTLSFCLSLSVFLCLSHSFFPTFHIRFIPLNLFAQRGSDDPLLKKWCPRYDANWISLEALINIQYSFMAMTPMSTFIRSGCICLG